MSKLIRVVQGRNLVREIRLDALLGKYFDRIEKAHGTVEIQDPELENKLTADELKRLYAKFRYLNAGRPLPPKPSTEPVAFRENVMPIKEVRDDIYGGNQDDVKPLKAFELLTNEEIVEWLTANEIPFDKRKKKNTEYLIQIITEQNGN